MNKILLSILIFFSVKVFSVEVRGTGALLKTISASGVQIPVYEGVSLSDAGMRPVSLKLSGGGIREKKVVIASVNVYFLLNYTDLERPLDGVDPLKSFQLSRNRVLRMTFLRDVDAEKIRQSFSEALKENAVSVDESSLKSILAGWAFDMKKGGVVDFIGTRSDGGTEKLELVFPTTTLAAQGKTLVTDFWKIWFGKPADGGLEDLKQRLTSLDQLMHM